MPFGTVLTKGPQGLFCVPEMCIKKGNCEFKEDKKRVVLSPFWLPFPPHPTELKGIDF